MKVVPSARIPANKVVVRPRACRREVPLHEVVVHCPEEEAPAVVAALNPVFAQAAEEAGFTGFRPHTTEVARVDDLAGLWALDGEVADGGRSFVFNIAHSASGRIAGTAARARPG